MERPGWAWRKANTNSVRHRVKLGRKDTILGPYFREDFMPLGRGPLKQRH
jgi:hypothetical protein